MFDCFRNFAPREVVVGSSVSAKRHSSSHLFFLSIMVTVLMMAFAVSAQAQINLGGEAQDPAAMQDEDVDAATAADVDTSAVAVTPLTDDPLEGQVEDLKQAVLNLNRDLLILEEELLFPANTQIAVFLSMDVGEFFQLDSVKLTIDGKLVASELYTPHQVDALFRGGVQRLYVGNLRAGSHEITAYFTGIGPEGREYKRGSTITIDKELEPFMLELKVVDSTQKLQPVFEIKEWQL